MRCSRPGSIRSVPKISPKMQMMSGSRSIEAPMTAVFEASTSCTSCWCTFHASSLSARIGSTLSQRGQPTAPISGVRAHSLPRAETALSEADAFSSSKACPASITSMSTWAACCCWAAPKAAPLSHAASTPSPYTAAWRTSVFGSRAYCR